MLAKRITRISKGDQMVVDVQGGVCRSSAPCDGFLVHTTLSEMKECAPIFVPSAMLTDAGKSKKVKR